MACKRKINFDEFDVSEIKESKNACPWSCYRFETFKKSKKDKIVKWRIM